MTQPLRVLILEDRPSDAKLVLAELRRAGYDPDWQRVDTKEEFVTGLEAGPDIVLADYNLPQFSAPEALQILRATRMDVPFIVVSGSIGEDVAVDAIKEGATDFLLKDRMGRLGQAVKLAMEQRRLCDTQRQAEVILQERARFISLTADIGLSLNQRGTLREMLQPCAESLVSNLDLALARIWTFDEAEDMLELEARAGIEAEHEAQMSRIRLEDHYVGRMARDHLAHSTNALADDRNFTQSDWAARHELTSFAGYPLLVENRLVGLVTMFSRRPFNQSALDGLASAAQQIATGVERKRAEERLQFTQFTMDRIGTAVFWSDATGRFFNVNDSACKMTGYSRAELLNLHVHDLDVNVHPHDWNRIWNANKRRRTVFSESRMRKKDGSSIPVSINTNLLEGATPECSCSFVQDISDREAAERIRRQSELRFRAIFEHTFEFLALLNCDGSVLEVNQPSLDFCGLNREDIAGKPLWDSQWLGVSPETQGQLKLAIMMAAGGNFVRKEVTVRDAADAGHIFDFSVKPVLNESRAIELLIVEARDITDQKLLEEQFRQAQKMEAIGKLAGGVAHDFNNLLTIMLGYSEVLQDRLSQDNPMSEIVEEIHSAGTRAASLTRQLLAFSRKQVLVPVVLNLNTLLAEMEKLLRRLIGEDIELEFRPCPNLGFTRLDPGQMEQVVMNLAVNARDAMPQGGKLTIETSNVDISEREAMARPELGAGSYVLIRVCDTGLGMDQATLSRVFEPFFSTKGNKGTGLGLATVYGIVKQSGGHIAVKSALGRGTTFEIYLPLDEARDAGARIKESQPSPRKQAGAETILLVEDEERVRELCRSVLQQHGYHVLVAGCGEEAMRINEQYAEPIQLLATDVVMPNMSGAQLAECLLPGRAGMKVLFMSGYLDDAIERHGIVSDRVPILQKPFTPSALTAKVRQVLDDA